MHAPPGLVIFEAVEGTFVHFTKGHDHFISNSIRCGCIRQDQCNIAACEVAYRNELAIILAVATLPSGNELRRLIFAVRVCRLPSLFSIMFSDTLCVKKWYDMPRIGCGIHSLIEVHDFQHW